jgi:hypothetical protein
VLWLGLFLFVLGKAEGRFETLVVAGLALLYIHVGFSTAMLSLGTADAQLAAVRRFVVLLRAVRPTAPPTDDVESIEDELKQATEDLRVTTVKFWISTAFSAIGSLVATWLILTA